MSWIVEDCGPTRPLVILGRGSQIFRGFRTVDLQKRILNLLLHHPALSPAGIEESESLVAQALASEDLQEGQAAFLEKRRPQFKGR